MIRHINLHDQKQYTQKIQSIPHVQKKWNQEVKIIYVFN